MEEEENRSEICHDFFVPHLGTQMSDSRSPREKIIVHTLLHIALKILRDIFMEKVMAPTDLRVGFPKPL